MYCDVCTIYLCSQCSYLRHKNNKRKGHRLTNVIHSDEGPTN